MNVLDYDFYLYIERMKKDLVKKNDAFYFGLPSDKFENIDYSKINNKKKEKNNKNNEYKKKQSSEKKFFEKIKSEFGEVINPKGKKKFMKMFTIFNRPNLESLNGNETKNKDKSNKKIIALKIDKDEDKQQMKKVIDNLENFNILKNKKMFDFNKNKNFIRRGTFSGVFNSRKSAFDSELNLPKVSMKMNIPGMNNMHIENLLIKEKEKEKESPEVKLFDEIVSIFKSRKALTFNQLFEEEEEDILKIINYQEFSTGNTMLIYAILNNLKSIVELLLLKGANPNLQNKFGNSALHIAYKMGNPYIVNLLLEYGADQKIKNKRGIFPWQFKN